jgi:hypothetical protein
METIPYRRSNLIVKTIPEGTLLFRILKNQKNDMRGVPIENDQRCLTPNFNVYFYPNPFAAQLAFEKYLDTDYDPYVYVYILNKDIKVISLINPSKYSRADKYRKGIFIKRCSTLKKGCLPRNYNSYDACLSDTIIKKFPEIVGTIAVVQKDARLLKLGLSKPKNATMRRFFKYAEDRLGTKTIPELSLHPLILRPSKDVITKEGDPLENNYRVIGKFDRRDQKSIINFMDTKTVYNPETFYYMLKTNK